MCAWACESDNRSQDRGTFDHGMEYWTCDRPKTVLDRDRLFCWSRSPPRSVVAGSCLRACSDDLLVFALFSKGSGCDRSGNVLAWPWRVVRSRRLGQYAVVALMRQCLIQFCSWSPTWLRRAGSADHVRRSKANGLETNRRGAGARLPRANQIGATRPIGGSSDLHQLGAAGSRSFFASEYAT